MFDAIDTAALLIWLERPYISSFGNCPVTLYISLTSSMDFCHTTSSLYDCSFIPIPYALSPVSLLLKRYRLINLSRVKEFVKELYHLFGSKMHGSDAAASEALLHYGDPLLQLHFFLMEIVCLCPCRQYRCFFPEVRKPAYRSHNAFLE